MIFLIFSLAYFIVRMRYIEHVMRKKGKSYMQTFSCVEGSRLPHPPCRSRAQCVSDGGGNGLWKRAVGPATRRAVGTFGY